MVESPNADYHDSFVKIGNSKWEFSSHLNQIAAYYLMLHNHEQILNELPQVSHFQYPAKYWANYKPIPKASKEQLGPGSLLHRQHLL